MERPTAHPLCWPEGWPRTPRGKFKEAKFTSYGKALTVATACDRVYDELEKLRAKDVIISTNVEPTLSGRPRSSQTEPSDSGAAIYWRSGKGPRSMAIDQYTTVAGNLGAIAATLEAMRAIDRHGGAEILERVFTGFAALPGRNWSTVLGVDPNAKHEDIKNAWKALAVANHESKGGDPARAAEVNAAWSEYEKERGL